MSKIKEQTENFGPLNFVIFNNSDKKYKKIVSRTFQVGRKNGKIENLIWKYV